MLSISLSLSILDGCVWHQMDGVAGQRYLRSRGRERGRPPGGSRPGQLRPLPGRRTSRRLAPRSPPLPRRLFLRQRGQPGTEFLNGIFSRGFWA
jgi:hypothetical protein